MSKKSFNTRGTRRRENNLHRMFRVDQYGQSGMIGGTPLEQTSRGEYIPSSAPYILCIRQCQTMYIRCERQLGHRRQRHSRRISTHAVRCLRASRALLGLIPPSAVCSRPSERAQTLRLGVCDHDAPHWSLKHSESGQGLIANTTHHEVRSSR